MVRARRPGLVEEADGDGRVLILPTASAPEGKDVFERWGSLGLAHFSRLDIPSEVLDLQTREDSDDPRLIGGLEGASAVYFSGGNPAYLSATLAESDFLDAMLKQLERGMAYAGCSAGVACLNEMTFDSDTTDIGEVWKPGLDLAPRTALLAPLGHGRHVDPGRARSSSSSPSRWIHVRRLWTRTRR